MKNKDIIFKIIKTIIPRSLKQRKKGYFALRKIHKETSISLLLKKGKVVLSDRKMNSLDDYVRQMALCFKKLKFAYSGKYIYPYDSWVWREIPDGKKLICSITVDFDKVLKSDIRQLKSEYKKCRDRSFGNRQIQMIEQIEMLANRISVGLSKENGTRSKTLRDYFPAMLYRKPLSMDEAIQKLLFYNALFWQANHWHIGLGRLDLILNEYYESDKKAGKLNREQAKKMILNMVEVLGKDTLTKSKTLVGDTGQYILLGGVDKYAQTVENSLTEIFLEIFKNYNRPDPKLILRVNRNTSNEIWDKAIECMCSGSGSPLIMNEKPIMDNMINFGYSPSDVWQLGTSACWEPLIIGKSFDQNNTFVPIMAYKPLNLIIKENTSYSNFKELYADYKLKLSQHISTIICDIDYDCSPLFTLFFDDCIKKEKDFTQGGARYAFHGAQVLSLPNTVNALLNIKEKIFEKRILPLSQCKELIETNYSSHKDLQEYLLSGKLKYGACDKEVLDLCNDLMTFIGEEVGKHKMNGNPVKVGFSSPNYIMSCGNTEATLDGRNANEPFAVHISPISSEIGIAEILDFATKLNYSGNRINGNIVDFTIPSSYMANKNKLRDLLIDASSKGLFEVQLNVLSYKKLVDAKAHPEKYPELIVRVWGFSAYFNDLPEIYKDNLIERAKLYGAA